VVVYYVMALASYAQASYVEVLRYLLEGVRWHCQVGGLCPERSSWAKLAVCSPTSPANLATASRPRSSAMPYGFIMSSASACGMSS
jgi:hypothetical protein